MAQSVVARLLLLSRVNVTVTVGGVMDAMYCVEARNRDVVVGTTKIGEDFMQVSLMRQRPT